MASSRKWDETTEVVRLAVVQGATNVALTDAVHTLVSSQRLVVVFPGRPVQSNHNNNKNNEQLVSNGVSDGVSDNGDSSPLTPSFHQTASSIRAC